MKNALALIAVAGIASAATAQTGSLSITSSAATIDSTATTSFTLSVWGDADFGTAVAGGQFALSANGGAGIVTDMSGAAAAWGALGEEDQGHGGDGNYNGLIFGQLIFPPFINPDAASMLTGSVLLGTVTVSIEANSAGVIDWSTAAGDGAFILEVFTDNGAEGEFTQLTSVDHGTARVSVVPAPSAMALLGLGGIAAGRRRR